MIETAKPCVYEIYGETAHVPGETDLLPEAQRLQSVFFFQSLIVYFSL